MLRSAILSFAVGLIIFTAAFAQFEAGTVVGSVKDPSGLPVANAVVEIRSVATNVARKTVTSATGDFDFVALQPSAYEIIAKQPGFKEAVRKFELSVGQRLELNLGMEVGGASQSVTVAESAVTVETASSEVSIQREGQTFLLRGLRRKTCEPGADVHLHGTHAGVPHGGFLSSPTQDRPACTRHRHPASQ